MADPAPTITVKPSNTSVYVLMAIIVVGLLGYAIDKHRTLKQIQGLQNQLALSAKTIEEKDGLYEKLTVQTSGLKNLLDSKDVQIKELISQVKDDKSQLVSVTTAVTTWKKAYEGLANAKQTEVPPPASTPMAVSRARVDFTKDFGYIGISGYTLTNPAEAYVKVQQNRPLKITLALAQAKDRSWRTYTTSSEENVSVDIKVAGVNPLALEPKWYEGLELQGQLGAGAGVLGGLGVGIKIYNFTVGPNAWMVVDPTPKAFYGMNFAWRPFERK